MQMTKKSTQKYVGTLYRVRQQSGATTTCSHDRLQLLGLPVVELRPGTTVPFTQTVCHSEPWNMVLDRTLSWNTYFDNLTPKVNLVIDPLAFSRSCITKSLR